MLIKINMVLGVFNLANNKIFIKELINNTKPQKFNSIMNKTVKKIFYLMHLFYLILQIFISKSF